MIEITQTEKVYLFKAKVDGADFNFTMTATTQDEATVKLIEILNKIIDQIKEQPKCAQE